MYCCGVEVTCSTESLQVPDVTCDQPKLSIRLRTPCESNDLLHIESLSLSHRLTFLSSTVSLTPSAAPFHTLPILWELPGPRDDAFAEAKRYYPLQIRMETNDPTHSVQRTPLC